MGTRGARRLYIGIAMAVIALLVPGLAGAANPSAAAKKKYTVNLVVKAAVVGTNGETNTVAGSFTGPPYGSGAVVYRAKPSGNDIAATYTGFTAKGTLRGTTLVTPTPQPDGSTAFTGTLQVAGGTGRYRGAKGKDLKVTGTLVNGVFTFQIKGTVRY